METLEEIPMDVFKQITQASIKILSGDTELSSFESLANALESLSEKANVTSKQLASSVMALNVLFQGKNS